MIECYDGYDNPIYFNYYLLKLNSKMLISTSECTEMLIKHKDLPQQI